MKTIRVGIIGAGFGRSAQLPGFRACDGVDVVGICASSLERAQAAAHACGIPHAYADYRQLVAQPDIDLVSIVTPPYLHRPMVVAAVEAGRHVLCEKPMALQVEDASDMCAAAEAAGVIHLIDHELRFNPTRRRMKQLLSEGFAGRVYHATVQMSTSYRADPVARPFDWWSEAGKGGGSLGATASHQIDLLQWWLGGVRRVSGQLHTFVPARKHPHSDQFGTVTSDDQCSFTAELESGALASVFITSVVRHPQGTRTEIHGDAGSLVLDAGDRLWGRRAGEREATELTVTDPNRDLPGVEPDVWSVSFVGLARYLVSCIRTGSRPEQGASFHDGLRCQAVMDAVRQSWAERRWVDVQAV